jgi:hypothetical protein
VVSSINFMANYPAREPITLLDLKHVAPHGGWSLEEGWQNVSERASVVDLKA